MRWLQCGKIDLEKGLGGVEVHARSVARELEKQGIKVGFSQDLKDLASDEWDVIHTHGSSFPIVEGLSAKLSSSGKSGKKPVRIQAIHGETLGRMAACGEWTWPGGYLAATREYAGIAQCDIVLADHSNLMLYRLGERLGKHCVVASNGWDSFDSETVDEALPEVFERRLQSCGDFWLFLGRGADPVKGADLMIETLRIDSTVQLVAVPGQGFDSVESVIKSGVLTSGQVRTVLKRARGMVLPSRYEGLPLAVLEALGQGIPVVATSVGGLKTLPAEVQGLVRAEAAEPFKLAVAIREARKLTNDQAARDQRAQRNRAILPDWATVAQRAIGAVEHVLRMRN